VSARLLAIVAPLVPSPAWACATCVASAYGDRTFNWAFVGLLAMPFVVGLGIAVVLVARYRALHSERTSGGAEPGATQFIHEESSL
jgi:hypothetical protein